MVSKGPNHLFMKPAAMSDEAYCVFIPSFGFVLPLNKNKKCVSVTLKKPCYLSEYLF